MKNLLNHCQLRESIGTLDLQTALAEYEWLAEDPSDVWEELDVMLGLA